MKLKAQAAGLKYRTVMSRIYYYGWTEIEALNEPLRRGKALYPTGTRNRSHKREKKKERSSLLPKP